MADTIKEFLVSLGFKVDESSFRKFKDGVGMSSADVAKLGLAATGTAVAVAAAVVKISKEYENLYWASQRTGATVTNLQAVSYAASQIGLSADQGKGAIEAMAASMRMNPGLQGLATAYGASAKDPVERLQQLVTGMKKAFGPDGYFAAAMQASNFGIPEPVFFQMWANIDKMKEEADDYKKRVKDVGLNTEETAKDSNALQTSLRRLGSDFDLLGTAISSKFIVPLKDAVDWIDKMILATGKITAMSAEQHHEGLKEKREKFRSGINSWLGEKLFPDLPESEMPTPPAAASPMAPRENADSIRAPANELDVIAQIESGGRANARTGRYKGKFQLSDEEFLKYGGGDIYNAADNERAASAKLDAQKAAFRRRHDRNPSLTELYMMHQQGEGGAEAHMAHPERPAWLNMYSTAEGRRRGPEWARKAIWGNVPGDMKGRFGGASSITSHEFMDLWHEKIDRFSARLGGGSRGWNARTEPTDEQSQADTFARGAKAEAPDITQHNNFTVHINGVTEPERVRDAMRDGARDWSRITADQLAKRQDTMR
jgi:hypothetical protein